MKTGGGAVNHVLTELDVSCLPDDLPEFIEVDLSNLQLGHSIHLSELTLPKGVESTQLRGGDDAVVVTIVVPRAEVEPEVEAAACGRSCCCSDAGGGACCLRRRRKRRSRRRRRQGKKDDKK